MIRKQQENKKEQLPNQLSALFFESEEQAKKMLRKNQTGKSISFHRACNKSEQMPKTTFLKGVAPRDSAHRDRKEKVDPRNLSLKELLSAANDKKIGDMRLNYQLYPGLLGNEQEFIAHYLAHTLSSKSFHLHLITPFDHRLLSTLLAFNFPREYDRNSTYTPAERSDEARVFYSQIYGMTDLQYYIKYLEVEIEFHRSSVKWMRIKLQEVIKQSVIWSEHPKQKKLANQLLKRIEEGEKSEQLLQQMQEELQSSKKHECERKETKVFKPPARQGAHQINPTPINSNRGLKKAIVIDQTISKHNFSSPSSSSISKSSQSLQNSSNSSMSSLSQLNSIEDSSLSELAASDGELNSGSCFGERDSSIVKKSSLVDFSVDEESIEVSSE